MAKEETFDVVSKVDMQEVNNAINQTTKEITQRYDFKNSKTQITVEDTEIKIVTEDDFKLRSVVDALQTKLVNRKVSIRNLEFGKPQEAGGSMVKQLIKIKQGLEIETAKAIVKDIKEAKIKVQAQIMGDQLRISGKNRDDLQSVIQMLRENDYGVELQYTNYR